MKTPASVGAIAFPIMTLGVNIGVLTSLGVVVIGLARHFQDASTDGQDQFLFRIVAGAGMLTAVLLCLVGWSLSHHVLQNLGSRAPKRTTAMSVAFALPVGTLSFVITAALSWRLLQPTEVPPIFDGIRLLTVVLVTAGVDTTMAIPIGAMGWMLADRISRESRQGGGQTQTGITS